MMKRHVSEHHARFDGKKMSHRVVPLPGITALCAFTLLALWLHPALGQHEHHHHMTAKQYAELREKIPLYREYTDAQIDESMVRMGPNFSEYLSTSNLSGNIGVLSLGHGFRDSGNEAFMNAHRQTANQHPTAVALGMAMMTSAHIQTAVDELSTAGVETILVVPVTTLRSGKLLRQWEYIFSERDDPPWLSVPKVKSSARLVLGPTPTDGELISQILLEHARELSRDPASEAVALIAHGATGAEDNALELTSLESHAAVIRASEPFAAVRGFTLQDDAPSEQRAANVAGIRAWMQDAQARGERVIIVTTLPVSGGTVPQKIRKDLAGLDYAMNETGIVEHALFGDWIESQLVSLD